MLGTLHTAGQALEAEVWGEGGSSLQSNSRDSEEQRSESARRVWRQQGGSRTAAENRTVGDDAECGWAGRPRILNVRYIAKPSPRSYREPREEDTRTL